jgi:integrase
MTLKAIFESARTDGAVSKTADNPWDKQRRKVKREKRLTYTDPQAVTLFDAFGPREVKPAKHTVETALAWGVLISAHSGLGLEEVFQLTVADVQSEGTNGSRVTFFDIHNGDKLHSLKNEETRPRHIPLHSVIERAGFLRYIAALPKDGQLFPGLVRRASKGNKIGARAGELFNRKVRALGMKPEKGMLDFHSWRHTVATKLRRAGVAEMDMNDILGHAHATETTKTYDHGAFLHHLKAEIDKIAYEGFTL